MTKKSEIKVPTFEELVSTELTKFDELVPKIEELKSQFLPLKIESLHDEEGYKEVAKALKYMVSKRTAIEEKRKELKADSLAYGRAVDARAKEITNMLQPIEYHLKSQKEEIDIQLEEIKKQEEEAKQESLKHRHNLLIEVGMNLIGNEYVNNDYENYSCIPAINLELWDDEEFVGTLAKIKVYYELNETRKKIEEEKLAKEKARIEQEQEEFKKEQQAMMEEKMQMRLEALINIGCIPSQITDFVFYKNVSIISIIELGYFTVSEWATKLAQIKDRISSIDVDEKNQLEAQIKARIDEENRIKEEEKEKIQNMSEKEKLSYYAKQLLSVEKPQMATQKWANELKKIVSNISFYVIND